MGTVIVLYVDKHCEGYTRSQCRRYYWYISNWRRTNWYRKRRR